jgi:hypothetical protein
MMRRPEAPAVKRDFEEDWDLGVGVGTVLRITGPFAAAAAVE